MGALEYSRILRRNRNYTESLLEIYELIPDLEPEIQKLLLDEEKAIQEIQDKVLRSIDRNASEYQALIETQEKFEKRSELLLRDIRRKLFILLHEAGYFTFEKGTPFHDPSGGRQSGDKKPLQLTGTIRRTV
jgi:hypothetical protein